MYGNQWTLRIYPKPCSPMEVKRYILRLSEMTHNYTEYLVSWLKVVLRIPSRKLSSLWIATKLSSLLLRYYGFVLDTLDRPLLTSHGTLVLGPPFDSSLRSVRDRDRVSHTRRKDDTQITYGVFHSFHLCPWFQWWNNIHNILSIMLKSHDHRAPRVWIYPFYWANA